VSQPLRLVIASVLASAVDLAVVALLGAGLGAATTLATAMACLAGGLANFALNRAWVFAGSGGPATEQAVRYFAWCVVGGALLSAALANVVEQTLGLPVLATRVLVAAIVMPTWSYPLSRQIFEGTVCPTGEQLPLAGSSADFCDD
jgi:putative flippase GtrA